MVSIGRLLTLDTGKRNDIYKRCLRMIYEDAQVAATYLASPILVYRKEVKGIRIQGFSQDIGEAWLDK